jgi:hypothetical protein
MNVKYLSDIILCILFIKFLACAIFKVIVLTKTSLIAMNL